MIQMSNWTNESLIQYNNVTQQAPPSSCTQEFAVEWSKGLLSFLYTILFLVAIGANSLIIHIVRVRQDMKTPFNYLIVNMAIADLLDALLVSYVQIWYIYGGIYPSGPFGEIICKLQQYLIVISISASVLTLTVITIDRYFAIVRVLKRPLSVCAVRRAVACTWIISGVLFSYELYKMQLFVLPNGKYTCGVVWGFDFETNVLLIKADMMVKLVLLYIIPVIVMVTLYSIILVHLSKQRPPCQFSERIQQKINCRKRKAVKILVTITTVFVVGWLPVHVNHTLIAFYWSTYQCTLPYEVAITFFWIAHGNAAINPCLYVILNKSFREGFKLVFNKVFIISLYVLIYYKHIFGSITNKILQNETKPAF